MHHFNGEYKDYRNWFDAIFAPKTAMWACVVIALWTGYNLIQTDDPAFLVAMIGWGYAAVSWKIVDDYEAVVRWIMDMEREDAGD